MSAQPQPRLTPEKYLAIERAAEFKSEYYEGHMYAMAGGSFSHFQIVGNLSGKLHAALLGQGCSVGSSDLRVAVSADGLYTYPGIVVICGEPKFSDTRKDTLTNPLVLAEVLSPSTEAYDRGFQFAQYRTIESLQEYVLVSQTEPRVKIFQRGPAGWLFSEAVGLDASCEFGSLNCKIPLAEIYANVTFDSAQAIPPRPPSV